MSNGQWFGIMFLGMYVISALGMWLFLKNNNKKENKPLDNDDKGLIFTPVINTIGLLMSLWDSIFY